ncbi:MAG: hypothetical protein WC917_00810 [Bacilli bacterium]|jgi:hypothetical protein
MDKEQIKKIQDRFDFWRQNPNDFIKEFWPNVIVWDKLSEVCNSVRDNFGTVVPSCHGAGKSFISAKIILWWLFTHFPSKVITTAPTWTQVETVLWGEIRSSVSSSKIKLVDDKCVLNTEIKISPDWFAKGISTDERLNLREYGSTKFQGFHSPNLLVVMDEAPGVDHSIHTALETLVTGKDNRILKIGNPTSPSGDFYNNCFSDNWHKIHISAFNHPNVKDNAEVIPGAITKQWIERMKLEWGESSPLWKAKVLGDFPDETEDTLIPLSWCEQAIDCEVEPNQRKVLGFDVARFGDDSSVAYEIKSNVASKLFKTNKEDTMAASGRIANIAQDYDLIGVDGVGVGGGVVDRLYEVLNSSLREDKIGHRVVDVQFGRKADEFKRFYNHRAEVYWHLRERLRPDGQKWNKIRIPNDDVLKAQLSAIKFSYASDGRIKIETKDEMKVRGLKSPDEADALAIACWLNRPEKPKELTENPIYQEFFEYKKKQQGNNLGFLDNL